MTALERGLAIAAFKEGKSVDYIAHALRREDWTINRVIKKGLGNATTHNAGRAGGDVQDEARRQ